MNFQEYNESELKDTYENVQLVNEIVKKYSNDILDIINKYKEEFNNIKIEITSVSKINENIRREYNQYTLEIKLKFNSDILLKYLNSRENLSLLLINDIKNNMKSELYKNIKWYKTNAVKNRIIPFIKFNNININLNSSLNIILLLNMKEYKLNATKNNFMNIIGSIEDTKTLKYKDRIESIKFKDKKVSESIKNNLINNHITFMYYFKDKLYPELFVKKHFSVREPNPITELSKLYLKYDINLFIDLIRYYKNDVWYLSTFNRIGYDDMTKIFEVLLSQDGGPEIVFGILDRLKKYSTILAEITLADPDYREYISKYLNLLEIYINDKKMYNLEFIKNNYIKEKMYYYKAKLIILKGTMTENDRSKVIEYLFLAGDYLDALYLKNNFIKQFYFELPLGSSLPFALNNDVKTIVKLLEYIKNNK